MAKYHILLDTQVSSSQEPVVKLYWEEFDDIRTASNAGVVAHPSKSAIGLMLRHIRATEWFEIPLPTAICRLTTLITNAPPG